MKKILNLFYFFLISQTVFAQAVIDTIDFESPSIFLELDSSNMNNTWQIGIPSKTVFSSAHSPVRAIVTDTLNSYPVNSSSSFTVGFELYGHRPSISFKYKIDTDRGMDGGFLEISKDSGATWLLLSDSLNASSFTPYFRLHGLATDSFYGPNDTLFNGNPGFSGRNSSNWNTAYIIFPCRAIKKAYEYQLRFTFISDSVVSTGDGWMIDDITIDNSGGCSSLNENTLAEIIASPNPFSEYTKINIGEYLDFNKGSVEIYDTQGKFVKSFITISGNKVEILRGGLKAGMYLALLKNAGIPLAFSKLLVQ